MAENKYFGFVRHKGKMYVHIGKGEFRRAHLTRDEESNIIIGGAVASAIPIGYGMAFSTPFALATIGGVTATTISASLYSKYRQLFPKSKQMPIFYSNKAKSVKK